MLGRSGWALVNSYYAAVRERGYQPDEVVIFAEEGTAGGLEAASEGIRAVSVKYGFQPRIRSEVVRDGDFVEAGRKMTETIKAWKASGNKIAVDITPGRKALVVGVLIPLNKLWVDHIFYLQIDDTSDSAKPYMTIPLGRQTLRLHRGGGCVEAMSSASRPSFTLDEEEAQILINLFLGDFELTYPITRIPLFSCTPTGGKYTLSTAITPESFGIRDEDPYLEGPSYADVLECMMSSGILGFTNMEEFKEKLKAYRAYKNTLFALDTNIVYRRFVSNTGLLNPKECVIVSTVRDEITSVHNYKYTQEQIIQMKIAAPFERGLLDELANRRMKKSRKAYRFANKELKALAAAIPLEAAERFSGQEGEGDRIIARTVSKCARERNAQIVLLTADSSMTDICDAEGIEHFLFEMPKEVPRESLCTGPQLRRLVADLACVLALVKMNSIIIYGEFRGKRDAEDLKAVFLDGRAADGFKKDLEVCRELKGLGFKF
jgi:uncharacterized protein YdhG (YjbR/CyaY superfamily)